MNGEPGVCSILTTAHVVDKEAKIRLRTENEGKAWDVATVEIFPNTIDLALVTFKPDTQRCDYPALTTGNSESLRKGSSIFIYGFPSRGEQPVAQFVDGKVSGFDKLARGYGVSYRTLTVGGMSGAPVVDRSSKVVAVHGMSDTEIVQSLASQKAGLSESEQELSQEAEESLKMASIERLTFSWAVPIAFFRESKFYYPQLSELSLWLFFSVGAIFGGGIVYFGLRYFQTPQVSGQRQKELERQLRDEQRRGKELEERLSSLQNQKTQAQQELERQLEWEKGKRQEVEAQLQRQGQVQPPVREPQSSGDVPLVSAVGVDYTKLRNLLVAKNWKEADLETGKRMLEVAGRESQGWLFSEDVENFPCQDLGTIDKLWVKYSGGKFGFSVQKQIYQDLGGTKDYDKK
ncbi:MAG: GUN4 domain-containing protein, partial [Trichodesmium sp. St7_bin2_1]|nr:GUN4 domain-containing protein [Trichodesmium sp. St7_bin2_1]